MDVLDVSSDLWTCLFLQVLSDGVYIGLFSEEQFLSWGVRSQGRKRSVVENDMITIPKGG